MIRKNPICSQHGHSITQWKQKKLFWKLDCENPAFNLTVSMYRAQVTHGLRLCAHRLLKTECRSYSRPFNVGHGHCQEARMLFWIPKAHTHVGNDMSVQGKLQLSDSFKHTNTASTVSYTMWWKSQPRAAVLRPRVATHSGLKGSCVRYLHYD